MIDVNLILQSLLPIRFGSEFVPHLDASEPGGDEPPVIGGDDLTVKDVEVYRFDVLRLETTCPQSSDTLVKRHGDRSVAGNGNFRLDHPHKPAKPNLFNFRDRPV